MSVKGGLRVAIVGAGIGGLSLSSALGYIGEKQVLEIDIYEASSHISDVGAGISIWPRTWEVMKVMGLAEHLLPYLPFLPDDSPRRVFDIRKSDQSEGFRIRDVIRHGGAIRFHRADLQRVLTNSMNGRLHLSHRLLSYEEKDDEVHLQFEHGQTATCDVLVGMDGIKSAVRRSFLLAQGLPDSPSLYPNWTGSIAYRALVPMQKVQEAMPGHRALTAPMLYSGKAKHIVAYPISQDKILNIVAYNTDVSKEGSAYHGPSSAPCTREEVVATFKGWEGEVQAMLQSIENPSRWVIRDLVPLKRYAYGRVILAGDAAHAMTPHQGAGAGQAIEDAFVLASLLTNEKCTKAVIPQVSEIYNTVCLPRGNHASEMSKLCGRRCELIGPGLENVVEGDTGIPSDVLANTFQTYLDALNWVFETSTEEERAQASNMFDSMEVVYHIPIFSFQPSF